MDAGSRIPRRPELVALLLLGSGVLLAAAGAQRRPTFARDVAPIVYAHCVSCHRPGQAAPFSLLSYDDVRSRGKEVVDAVLSRHMPPWRAASAPGFPALRADRRLTDRQIAVLGRWVENGMPPGDLARAPLPPAFPTGWALGVPDLTLSLPRPFFLPAGSADRLFNVVFPMNLAEDRWVRAIDYQPSTRGVVSHAIFMTVPSSAVVDDQDLLPGFGGLLGAEAAGRPADRLADADRTLETLGVWVPGGVPAMTPDGAALRLPKRSTLVMQLHARASDTGAIEDGRVAIYLSHTPPARVLTTLQVPPSFGIAAGLDIPAGDPRFVLKDSFTVPVDVEAFGARGHAHDLGRELTMTATLPNGTTRRLLWIDRWDVNWQETYFFAAPVRLPKGTTIHVEIAYDNSASNPRNPSSPPQRVAWGPKLSDEVGSMALVIAAPGEADAAALAAARSAHLRQLLLRSPRR